MIQRTPPTTPVNIKPIQIRKEKSLKKEKKNISQRVLNFSLKPNNQSLPILNNLNNSVSFLNNSSENLNIIFFTPRKINPKINFNQTSISSMNWDSINQIDILTQKEKKYQLLNNDNFIPMDWEYSNDFSLNNNDSEFILLNNNYSLNEINNNNINDKKEQKLLENENKILNENLLEKKIITKKEKIQINLKKKNKKKIIFNKNTRKILTIQKKIKKNEDRIFKKALIAPMPLDNWFMEINHPDFIEWWNEEEITSEEKIIIQFDNFSISDDNWKDETNKMIQEIAKNYSINIKNMSNIYFIFFTFFNNIFFWFWKLLNFF